MYVNLRMGILCPVARIQRIYHTLLLFLEFFSGVGRRRSEHPCASVRSVPSVFHFSALYRTIRFLRVPFPFTHRTSVCIRSIRPISVPFLRVVPGNPRPPRSISVHAVNISVYPFDPSHPCSISVHAVNIRVDPFNQSYQCSIFPALSNNPFYSYLCHHVQKIPAGSSINSIFFLRRW